MTTTAVISGAFVLLIALAATVAGVALLKLKRANVEMAPGEFFRRMLRKAGYGNITAATLFGKLASNPDTLVVDIRDEKEYRKGYIAGAVHDQFDSFLKAVVVEQRYDEHRDRELILVCDTGHMSRVAGEILVEDEGFTRVSNLRGGMKSWQRWQARQQQTLRCCNLARLTACCGWSVS